MQWVELKTKDMSKTTYPGINYAGIGSTTNMDAETGIRYGVISQNSVMPEAVDDIYYGPHSRDLAWEAGIEEAKQQIMRCYEEDLYEDKNGELKKVLKNYVSERFIEDRLSELMDLFSEMVSDPPGGKPNLPDVEHVLAVVEQDFSDNAGDHECNPLYEHDGYKITKCLDSDLMILKSPFFTYASFCSPCVPGACNLDSPLDHIPEDGSNACYCLDHSWFEGGVAPYPVFNFGGAEILPGKILDDGTHQK